MSQVYKFAFVGVINTLVDFAVLNWLLFIFGFGINGSHYVFFKSISFVVAVVNSYFFNKFWVFEKKNRLHGTEPYLFFSVSIIGMLLNVSISSLMFQFLSTHNVLSVYLSVNTGALVGSVGVLVWNFVGYKFIVFKAQDHE